MSYVFGTNKPNDAEQEAQAALKAASAASGISVSDILGAVLAPALGTAVPKRSEGINLSKLKKLVSGENVKLRTPRTPAEHKAAATASA